MGIVIAIASLRKRDRLVPTFKFITYHVAEDVALISLNTPERLNALSMGPGSNRNEIVAALAAADVDDNVGCVLFTAAGRAFCAGGDLKMSTPREKPEQQLQFFEDSAAFLGAVRNCGKPTVAAVQGYCLGAGLGFIAQMDLVLAAEDAWFGLVEGAMGLPGAPDIVPLIGAAWAKFLIFTGEMVTAQTAKDIGLVFAVTPPAQLVQLATLLARRIARAPRTSVQMNKKSINSVVDAIGFNTATSANAALEALTAEASRFACAPDGRLFSEILASEGPQGVRRAYQQPSWLELLAKTKE